MNKEASSDYQTIDALPVVQGGHATVEVIAPAAMPGGYQFSVDVDGRHVRAAVVRFRWNTGIANFLAMSCSTLFLTQICSSVLRTARGWC